jgi:predicted kinase
MRLGGVVYSSDRVRKELAGVAATHRANDDIDAGMYSSDMSRRTYDQMRQWAADALARGESVILDATYRAQSDRAAISEMARTFGSRCWIVECQLPESAALARIAARQSSGEGASDADAEIYQVQRGRYEAIEPTEANHVCVDTSKSIAAVVNRVMQRLLNA